MVRSISIHFIQHKHKYVQFVESTMLKIKKEKEEKETKYKANFPPKKQLCSNNPPIYI